MSSDIALPSSPSYLSLYTSGELERRVERALELLRSCRLCPRCCQVDRLEDEAQFCRTGRRARLASYAPHHGEEDCLRGLRGSGTIFFTGCNLGCVFCQNADISQRQDGPEADPELLADVMLELQANGCHNINLVSPTHVVPQWLEALPLAVRGGLRLPIVYNTGAYDAPETLRLLDGIVDIYMPDFKYWDPERARRYLQAPDYPEVARAALTEMHRQVGDLRLDDGGLAVRGLLVRHLVMPQGFDDSRAIFRFLAALSPATYVNIMGQYRPANRVDVDHHSELDRAITSEEMTAAYRAAEEAGLHRFDERQRWLP
jgi:putative pyruvate formate lyase activating enzyme